MVGEVVGAMVVRMADTARMVEVDVAVEVALEVEERVGLTGVVVEDPVAEEEWEWAIVEDSISLVGPGIMELVGPICRSRITLTTTPSLYKVLETTILWTLLQTTLNRSASSR